MLGGCSNYNTSLNLTIKSMMVYQTACSAAAGAIESAYMIRYPDSTQVQGQFFRLSEQQLVSCASEGVEWTQLEDAGIKLRSKGCTSGRSEDAFNLAWKVSARPVVDYSGYIVLVDI